MAKKDHPQEPPNDQPEKSLTPEELEQVAGGMLDTGLSSLQRGAAPSVLGALPDDDPDVLLP